MRGVLVDSDVLSGVMRGHESATAREQGLSLATGNIGHFQRIPGLRIEPWLA